MFVKGDYRSFTIEIDRAIKEVEVVFIGVGTPSMENGEATTFERR